MYNIDKILNDPYGSLENMTIDEMKEVIEMADDSFFNSDEPILTDEVYDILKDHLLIVDPDYKKVGANVKGKKVKLPYWMGSMDKIKNDISTWTNKYTGDVIISDKLDGISGMIHEGKFYKRGDGEYGTDITKFLKLLNIPKTDYTVRGELVISKYNFANLPIISSNPRNFVAGLMNAKKPDPELVKFVDFIVFEIINSDLIPSKQLELLNKDGFKTVYHIKEEDINKDKLEQLLIKRKCDGLYDIDGLVIRHNKKHKRETSGNPKYAFAFKSESTFPKAEVIVTDIEWNISKHKYLKPTVIFDPVKLGDVTVRRATGVNAKNIFDNGIGIGAKLLVIRSGDVIPHIKEVIKEVKPTMPKVEYKWNDTRVDIYVEESDEADEKIFISMIVKLNIEGLKEGTLAKLYKNGINTLKKIKNLTKEQLLDIEGFKEKSSKKLIEAIKNKQFDCIELMSATSLFGRGLADKTFKIILDKYNINVTPTMEQLIELEGIAEKTALNYLEGLPKFREFMKENDVECKTKKQKSVKNKLFLDKKIVMTGFRDLKIQEFIELNGGEVTNSISKNTYLLIYKDESKSTTKLTKAKELDVSIIQLNEFKENIYDFLM